MSTVVTTPRHGQRAKAAPRHPWSRRRWLALSGVVYLVVSLGVWWGVWTHGLSSQAICPCGDAARFLWFFAWPAFALTHGHSVWFSTWLFHPQGFNLLADTSVLALGVLLTPVTLVAGPVVSMNVASILAPALAAWAMCFLVARWVRWFPSACIAGLFYGFSPFVLAELGYGQLNMSFLVVPPLVVAALDQLLVRQDRPAVPVGLALGAAVVFEFFVSIEMLLMMAMVALAGVVVAAVFVALRHPGQIRPRLAHGAVGLGTAAAVSGAVLAYPLWYFLAGPAHLSGPIWTNSAVSRFGNSLTSFFDPSVDPGFVTEMHHFGGYQGPGFPTLGFLGAGVVVVCVAGIAVWRHDRRLLFFGALGVISAALSLGPANNYWVPWDVLEHLGGIRNIAEVRFSALTTMSAAVILGVVVDRVHQVGVRWAARRPSTAQDPGGPRRTGRPAVVGGVGALVVTVAALVPSLAAVWPNVPLTTAAVRLPQWYAQAGAHLPAGRVVLAYPTPFSGIQSSMAWQAVDTMGFAMAGGGGPAGVASRAGAQRPGFEVLQGVSLPLGPAPVPTPANTAAVRQAFAAWQVTTVVVPDQPELPPYDQGRDVPYAVGFFTAVEGRPPVRQDRAWVWHRGNQGTRPLGLAPGAFAACISAGGDSVQAVAHCVVAQGTGAPRR